MPLMLVLPPLPPLVQTATPVITRISLTYTSRNSVQTARSAMMVRIAFQISTIRAPALSWKASTSQSVAQNAITSIKRLPFRQMQERSRLVSIQGSHRHRTHRFLEIHSKTHLQIAPVAMKSRRNMRASSPRAAKNVTPRRVGYLPTWKVSNSATQ